MSNISISNKIFKSRRIILEQLESRGYDTTPYNSFGINELHILNQNNQLDMLIKNNETEQKCYIKYHLTGKLTKTNMYEYIEDLFNIENVLTDTDDFIIIIKDKINTTLKSFITNLFFRDNKFISVYNINRYLFNILDHSMVPQHLPIKTKEEKESLEKKFNIVTQKQWPEISRFDPVAQAVGLRPNELCRIFRKSPTSSTSVYYRLCI